MWLRIARRLLLLFAIGVLFNFLIMLCENSWHAVSPFRLMGVLQRISLCYGTVALLYLLTPVWLQRLVVLAMTLGTLRTMAHSRKTRLTHLGQATSSPSTLSPSRRGAFPPCMATILSPQYIRAALGYAFSHESRSKRKKTPRGENHRRNNLLIRALPAGCYPRVQRRQLL